MSISLKCLLVVFIVEVAQGAWVDFLCPRNPPAPGQNSSVFFPCTLDCIHQHGSFEGTCGDASKGDFNCYCGQPSGKRYEPSLQCIQPHQERYREMCTADCRCNHGATGGYCDWDLKACICQGFNPNSVGCPVKTLEEYAWFVYTKAGRKDLGPFGLSFIGAIIPIPLN